MHYSSAVVFFNFLLTHDSMKIWFYQNTVADYTRITLTNNDQSMFGMCDPYTDLMMVSDDVHALSA